MKNLVVLEGNRMEKYSDFFGLRSPIRRVRGRKMNDLSGLKSFTRRVTAPVARAVAPVAAVVQKAAAPAVAVVQQAAAVAAPIVQPVVQQVQQQVAAQVDRATELATQYGLAQLEALKAQALAAAKNPAIQNTAIMAAASAVGQPGVGAALVTANSNIQNTYDQMNQMERAMAQYNANPSSATAARIVSNPGVNPDTAAFISAYNNQLDARATGIALRNAGLPESAGLSLSNPVVIGGILLGGGLLFLLATMKKR